MKVKLTKLDKKIDINTFCIKFSLLLNELLNMRIIQRNIIIK